MGILCSLNPNPRLANAHSMLTYGTRGATTRDTITPPPRRLRSTPCFGRTHTSGGESVARQCTLVRDSVDDKQ